jgi:hypothetical protein
MNLLQACELNQSEYFNANHGNKHTDRLLIIFKNNGTESLKMLKNIQKGFIQEALEIGEKRGELRSYVNLISDILNKKFGRVPKRIENSLNKRKDVIVLKALVVQAATCSSLDEFATGL